MVNSEQPDRPAYCGAGLDALRKADKVIVLKIPGVLLSPEDGLALLRSALPPDAGPGETAVTEHLHLCHSIDAPETYLYLSATAPYANLALGGNDEISRLQHAAGSLYSGARADVFEVTQVVDGASVKRAAGWHYVVETDVLPEAENDFNAWYGQEHLPGLAAVPGTVRAMRLRNATGSPRYHALYLLENRETFGSEPWLKVRATEWSSRVRPNFINTKRTLFRIQP